MLYNLGEESVMKKVSNSWLAACLLFEVILALSLSGQAGNQPVFWIGVGIFAVLAGITAYFLIQNISESYEEKHNFQNSQMETYRNELSEFRIDCLKAIQQKSDVWENDISQIVNGQKTYSLQTEKFCVSIQLSVDEISKRSLELSESVSRNSKDISLLRETVSDYIKQSSEFSKKQFEALTDTIEKSDKQMKDIVNVLMNILAETKKAIVQGNEDALENYQDFNDSFDDNISALKKLCDLKLSEYNDTFHELEKQMNAILSEVQQNVRSYNHTLNLILESQKEMNNLTSEDVQLLEKLVKR